MWPSRWKIVRVLAASIMLVAFMVMPASAKERYESNLSNGDLHSVYDLHVGDIPNALDWIQKRETFIMIEDGTFGWWNVPNLQQVLYNRLYAQITTSGYGLGQGKPPQDRIDPLIAVPGTDGAHTALQRYGFDLPSPTYVGERPLIDISITGVLTPNGVFDSLGRAWDLATSGTIISYPKGEDWNSLLYLYPHDYGEGGATFRAWVRDHWQEAVSRLDPNQVILPIANEDGTKHGKLWTAEAIIFHFGLDDPSLTPDQVCQELEEICGRYYGQVAQGIVQLSGVEGMHHTERLMPWDLDMLQQVDKATLGYVRDPRADAQDLPFDTGYWNEARSLFTNVGLAMSSGLCEVTIAINRVTTLEALNESGFPSMTLWSSGFLHFVASGMLAALVVRTGYMSLKYAVGRGNGLDLIIRSFSGLIACFVTVAVFWFPQQTHDLMAHTAIRLMSISDNLLTSSQPLHALYGTGDDVERQECNLWLPYFDMYTSYQTGHGLLDDAQSIATSSGPEMNGLIVPDIDGVQQDAWVTVLLEQWTGTEKWDGDMYRAVDHFTAPRVQFNGGMDLTVKMNENWEGVPLQSHVSVERLPLQLLMLALVLVKAAVFMEWAVCLFMFPVQLAVGSVSNLRGMLQPLKHFFALALDVTVIHFVLCMSVWCTLAVDGLTLLLLTLVITFAFVHCMNWLLASNGVWTPQGIRKPWMFLKRTISGLVRPVGVDTSEEHVMKELEGGEQNAEPGES